MSARRTLGQFPLMLEQIFKKVIAPLRRCLTPSNFQTAGDGVATFAGAKAVLPAQALRFEAGCFRFRSHMGGRASPMSLAKSMTARDERHGFFVVHRHASESFADVFGCRNRIGISVWPFRVDVNQTHLHGGERIFEIPVAGITAVGFVARGQPNFFSAPINILIRFPNVFAPAAETECLEAHRFEGDIARENHQVSP